MKYENLLISKDHTVREALQLLDTAAKKVLFVVENMQLIGAVSDGDVRRWILKSESLDSNVSEIMNKTPYYINTIDRELAFDKMNKLGITAIPVVDENNVVVEIFSWIEDEETTAEKVDIPVVIMAGGKGERLKPFTNILPKPLIPINEKPIIEHIMDSFNHYGCNEFYITLNYKKAMLKAYFEEVDYEYTIKYVEESKPLGTGGSLYYLADSLQETFFVSNCDILLDVDYNDVYKYHKKNGNIVTILTSLIQYAIPYGVVEIKSDGQVDKMSEKPQQDHLVNTGVYLVEPDIFNCIDVEEYVQMPDLVERLLSNNQKVGTYPIGKDQWMDMGQLDDLEKMKSKLE